MKFGRSLPAILVVCCASGVLSRTAAADELDRRTTLTFDKAFEVPGRVLPAGTYVFQLAESLGSRHVVRVFAEDGRILATVLTIPAARRTPADGTRITFGEARAGAALGGEEFVYRRQRAADSSAN